MLDLQQIDIEFEPAVVCCARKFQFNSEETFRVGFEQKFLFSWTSGGKRGCRILTTCIIQTVKKTAIMMIKWNLEAGMQGAISQSAIFTNICQMTQGGRCCASARAALTERSGSSTKGRFPNIRYFVAKRFTRFLKGFHRAFNESHPAFVELSTKAILLS